MIPILGFTMSLGFSRCYTMTTISQVVATQAQVMTGKANQEVGACVQQNASTMDSRLWDFTRRNPPMFFGSKVNENP